MSARQLSVLAADGTRLEGEQAGEGRPVVLLHGLTATRRYVVMGSRLLERSGHRVVAYDARGHGRSSPAPCSAAYTYRDMSGDLLAVLDALAIEHATIAGASMGAHTAVRFALDHPERVAALALITPAYEPERLAPAPPATGGSAALTRAGGDAQELASGHAQELASADVQGLASWDALARGLREGGVNGFMAAYDFDALPEAWRATGEKVVRQRLAEHEHPEAVADALEAVPRSRPFERMADLERIEAPTVVVASRDEADPSHPLAVGERYAEAIPHARLVVEEAGPPLRSPIAWQGGQLSKVIAGLAAGID